MDWHGLHVGRRRQKIWLGHMKNWTLVPSCCLQRVAKWNSSRRTERMASTINTGLGDSVTISTLLADRQTANTLFHVEALSLQIPHTLSPPSKPSAAGFLGLMPKGVYQLTGSWEGLESLVPGNAAASEPQLNRRALPEVFNKTIPA